jgi:hypothetical protein
MNSDHKKPVLLIIDDRGRCIGRCDSHCYLDDEHYCKCVCGGVNHGVGLAQAAANALAGINVDWRRTFAKVPKHKCRVIVPRGTYRKAYQLQLFTPQTGDPTNA